MTGQTSEHEPAAELVKTGQSSMRPADRETLVEQSEQARDEAAIQRKLQSQRGKVALFLNAKLVVQDRTFEFLTYGVQQLEVSEFYPQLNIAVDKFYPGDEIDMGAINFKRKQFKKHGIQYAYLTPDKDLVDLVDQLDLPEPVLAK